MTAQAAAAPRVIRRRSGCWLSPGIRQAEALALDRQDIDLRRGVLQARAGKQDKQCEVPRRHSMIRALRDKLVRYELYLKYSKSARHRCIPRFQHPRRHRQGTSNSSIICAQILTYLSVAYESNTGLLIALTPRSCTVDCRQAQGSSSHAWLPRNAGARGAEWRL